MDKLLVFIAYTDGRIVRFFSILLLCFGIAFILYNFILSSVIIGIVVLYLIVRTQLTENYRFKGSIFEKKIKLMIEKQCKKNNWFLSSDYFTTIDNKTSAQIDNILVTNKAIYAIEVKNYTGWIYGNENDEYWIQSYYQAKNRFFNPIMQNKKHIDVIKKVLNLFDNIPVYNIIVFNDSCILKDISISGDNIYAVKDFDLLAVISNVEGIISNNMSESSVSYIKDKLIKTNVLNKAQRINYYNELKRKHISNY